MSTKLGNTCQRDCICRVLRFLEPDIVEHFTPTLTAMEAQNEPPAKVLNWHVGLVQASRYRFAPPPSRHTAAKQQARKTATGGQRTDSQQPGRSAELVRFRLVSALGLQHTAAKQQKRKMRRTCDPAPTPHCVTGHGWGTAGCKTSTNIHINQHLEQPSPPFRAWLGLSRPAGPPLGRRTRL